MSQPQTSSLRLLVVRNDKLGDFMLAWPALAALKQACAELHISVLVPDYTAALAEVCPWVDEVIIDPGDSAGRSAQTALLTSLKAARFHAMLTLYSTPRIGWLGLRAGIPLRVAPATKWAQVFYSVRIRQRRSRSAKPEYQYNVELAQALLKRLGHRQSVTAQPPFWPLDDASRSASRQQLADIFPDADSNTPAAMARQLIIIHPGSGGSAVNLTLEQYAELARLIQQHIQAQSDGLALGWLVSAGPGEEAPADELYRLLAASGLEAARLPASPGLVAFSQLLSGADLLIAGSTGPLHIAGCLNLATAGFYPAKRSATALRWQTCNAAEKRLAFSPPLNTAADDNMAAVDIPAAAQAVAAYLLPNSQVTACNPSRAY